MSSTISWSYQLDCAGGRGVRLPGAEWPGDLERVWLSACEADVGGGVLGLSEQGLAFHAG